LGNLFLFLVNGGENVFLYEEFVIFGVKFHLNWIFVDFTRSGGTGYDGFIKWRGVNE
jgi:hypothetical protein